MRIGLAAASLLWIGLSLTQAHADEPLRVRVLSYNIHHGEGVDGKLDLSRLGRVIASAQPDLVALQEVDRRVVRSWLKDQPAELGRLTEMQAVFGGNLPLQAGEYGNAVLSRWKILKHENQHLPRRDAGEQRGLLRVEVELPGATAPLVFFGTHLDHRPADAERLAGVEVINQQLPTTPAILAGDLNAAPDSAVLRALGGVWHNATQGDLLTYPAEKPDRQLDYVLVAPAARWRVLEVRVLEEAVASDHRPILAVLELLPVAGR